MVPRPGDRERAGPGAAGAPCPGGGAQRSPVGRWLRAGSFWVGVLAALAQACTPPAPTSQAPALVWRIPGTIDSLDPARASRDRQQAIIRRTHEGLVSLDPLTALPVPGLAESWTVEAEATLWTFRLRQGARFHDGRPLAVEDVVYSLERHFDPSVASSLVPFLADIVGARARLEGQATGVEGIRAAGPGSVEIRLDRPFVPLLGVLAMPQAAIVPAGSVPPPVGESLPGTGPFVLSEWAPGRHLRLEPFGGPSEASALAAVTFRIIADDVTALAAYEAGEVDVLDGLPPGRRREVAAARPGEYRFAPGLGLVALGVNHERGPLAESAQLRQAVAHVIDRDYICRVLNEGKDSPATQLLPPGLIGSDPQLGGFPYDLDEARRLLRQAGHPGGVGLPALRVAYPVTDSTAGKWLERLQADLAEVGVGLELEPLEYAIFADSIGVGGEAMAGYDLFRLTWLADYPDPDGVFTPLLHSDSIGRGAGNVGYRDRELDALLDRGRATLDPAARAAIYRQAGRQVQDRAAILPVYWRGDELLVRPGVAGMEIGPLGETTIPLQRVRIRG